MSILQQMISWTILISSTIASWIYLPTYGGTSLVVSILLCGLLICTHDLKKQNKKVEVEHNEELKAMAAQKE